MTTDPALVDRLVRELLDRSRPVEGSGHLGRAVAATRLAEAAERAAREEVIASRTSDGTTWAAIGRAFGVSTQTAHERFRSGPDGLHSRRAKARP